MRYGGMAWFPVPVRSCGQTLILTVRAVCVKGAPVRETCRFVAADDNRLEEQGEWDGCGMARSCRGLFGTGRIVGGVRTGKGQYGGARQVALLRQVAGAFPIPVGCPLKVRAVAGGLPVPVSERVFCLECGDR